MQQVILLPHGFQPEYEAGFANGLARNGWQVTLLGSDMTMKDRLDPAIRLLNFRGSQSPLRPTWRKAANMLWYWLRLYVFLLVHRSTLVHVIGTFSTGDLRLSLIEATMTRIVAGRYLITVHNLVPHDSHSARSHRLSRWIYKTAGYCMVHTNQMRETLTRSFGIPAQRIVVVEHGIDRVLPDATGMRDAMRQRLKLNVSDKVALFFGNIAPYKGLDLLLEAFGMLPVQGSFKLVIAGRCRSQKLRQELLARINANPNHDAIQWQEGYVAEEDVAAYFHAADILVMPYRHIDQSGVVFMAIATGLKVLATDVGSLRNYVAQHNGWIVPANDCGALANGIQAAIAQGASARRDLRSAQDHLWSATVLPLLRVYNNWKLT